MTRRKKNALALATCLTFLAGTALAGFGFPKAEGLDVHDVVADPSGYTGEIAVRGGVMSVDAEKHLFNIIDYREYRGCRTVECAVKWLSVAFASDLPEKWDVVEVAGAIEKSDLGEGGWILKATEVRVTGTYKR